MCCFYYVFSRTCGVCLNLKCIYIFIVITFKLIWFAVCVCWGGGGGIKKYLTNLFCFFNFVLKFLFFCSVYKFYNSALPCTVADASRQYKSKMGQL